MSKISLFLFWFFWLAGRMLSWLRPSFFVSGHSRLNCQPLVALASDVLGHVQIANTVPVSFASWQILGSWNPWHVHASILHVVSQSDIMFKLFKYCSSHSPSLALHRCLCFACILDNRSLASMKTTHSAEYFLGTRRQLLWQGCALAPSCDQGLNPRLKAPNAPMAVQRPCLVTILFFTQVFAQC